jgi:hypothetical protein
MPTKMLNPNTTIWVVPAAAVVNPLSPTENNLNVDGKNVSCAVTRGYTMNPTDSDTDDTASICDTGNTKTRLFDNYEGELTFFKDANLADNTSVYNIAFNLFMQPDQLVWIYRRLGKKNTAPAVTGDVVEGFLFTNDRTRSVDGADTGPVQFTVPLLPQGNYTGYTYVGVVSAPTITGVNPAAVNTAGGQTVTVTGTNLGSVYSLTVGGVVVPANVLSNTSLTFVTPARAAGTTNAVATNSLGSSPTATANQLTYS